MRSRQAIFTAAIPRLRRRCRGPGIKVATLDDGYRLLPVVTAIAWLVYIAALWL